MYRVEHPSETEVAASVEEPDEIVMVAELHRRMGHIALEAAKMLVKRGIIEGLKLDEASTISSCDSCEYGKAHRKPISKVREKAKASEVGDEVHSDVWGPSPVQTIIGRHYYASFTDDCSRFTHLYLLRTKDETFDAFKAYSAEVFTQKGLTIKTLHTDQGGEYLSEEFSNHLAWMGTKRNFIVHDTLEHNGVAERLNRTVLEKVRTMLHDAGLPKYCWGEAAKHAVYLKNHMSTRSLGDRTTFEVFYG